MGRIVEIECIGDDVVQMSRMYGTIAEDCGRSDIKDFLDLGKLFRPWIAKICGEDEKFGFKRDFVKCIKDYSRSNSVGSRGVYAVYDLEPGIYDSYGHRCGRRYFRVTGNLNIEYITKSEVLACLRKTA